MADEGIHQHCASHPRRMQESAQNIPGTNSNQKTPEFAHKKLCIHNILPVAMLMTFFPCKAVTFIGFLMWSSVPWPSRW